jgi:hypothetical protein
LCVPVRCRHFYPKPDLAFRRDFEFPDDEILAHGQKGCLQGVPGGITGEKEEIQFVPEELPADGRQSVLDAQVDKTQDLRVVDPDSPDGERSEEGPILRAPFQLRPETPP